MIRKPKARIFRYDGGSTLWGIEMPAKKPHDWKKPRYDWETCPGTLHQAFESAREAIEVAKWWGYRT
jgi:hypothetical protein